MKNIIGSLASTFNPSRSDSPVINPADRREIRPDFPYSQKIGHCNNLLDTLNAELEKGGVSLRDAGTITIAYPHKDPVLFPGYVDSFDGGKVKLFAKNMKKSFPKIKWKVADSLVETVALKRTTNQYIVHTLTGKQIYTLAGKHNPFSCRSGDCRNPYFIVVDHFIEQGTTIANLMSFIEHNGGRVLLAASYRSGIPIAQDERARTLHLQQSGISGDFADPARNTSRLGRLASVFFNSAQISGSLYATPQECLADFDAALRRHGNSVFALTDGECMRLINSINGQRHDSLSFCGLIDTLNDLPPATTPAPLPPDRGPAL